MASTASAFSTNERATAAIAPATGPTLQSRVFDLNETLGATREVLSKALIAVRGPVLPGEDEAGRVSGSDLTSQLAELQSLARHVLDAARDIARELA